MARLAVALVAAVLAVVAAPASGAPCAGFTDVDDTNPFCPSVAWMKNRSITTGCTLTEYCPSSLVSRLAMAAFMNRLFPLTCGNGRIMKWNGADWACANDNAGGGGGTVTSVSAGTGLQGTSCFANNEFIARSLGGFYFWTAGSNDSNYSGARLAPGSGAWSAYSDRNGKENIERVDAADVLQTVVSLPVATWNWKAQNAGIRHMGPMTQDFDAAFGLGESDTMIGTVDADGVALAAIQGLNAKLEAQVAEKNAEITALRREVSDLRASHDKEIANLRLAVEVLMARTSGEGRAAQTR
jgi:hypothetical protein